MTTMLRRLAHLLAALGLLTAVAWACSTTPEPSPTPSPTPAAEVGDLTVVLASTDVAVGPNRLVFGVLDSASPIRVPEARVSVLYLETTPFELVAQAAARFIRWPAGAAGVYVTSVSFDRDGRWGIIVEVTGEGGKVRRGQAGLLVKQQSSSPGIGQPVPHSPNKTAGDVGDLSELTTSLEPDPGLYRMTIAEAVSSGKPTVVTFATPAFCQTATCGPQVEVVSSIKDRYGERANFIHVEVYDNPTEMEGDISKGRLVPLIQEWSLLSEPFTFVLDSSGLVASKFEGFVTEEELEAALADSLGS